MQAGRARKAPTGAVAHRGGSTVPPCWRMTSSMLRFDLGTVLELPSHRLRRRTKTRSSGAASARDAA